MFIISPNSFIFCLTFTSKSVDKMNLPDVYITLIYYIWHDRYR